MHGCVYVGNGHPRNWRNDGRVPVENEHTNWYFISFISSPFSLPHLSTKFECPEFVCYYTLTIEYLNSFI